MDRNSIGILRIKKRGLSEWLTLYIFVLPFMLSFLIDFLGISSIIKYTIDVAWVGCFAILFIRKNLFIEKKNVPFVVFIIVWLLYVITIYLFNFQSPFYFLWGFRNNIRYYIAFIAFISFLNKDDLHLCLKYFDILFVINVVVTFYQFFFLGYKWDYLGGIFGVQLGCNGNTMILIIFVSIKSLLSYMNGKENLFICLLKCGVSLVIASMAELKFFFLLFICIVILASLITRFSWRKILIIIGISAIVFVSSNLFTAIWGEASALSLDRIIELITSTKYSSAKDLGRFTAIPVISETILTDNIEKIFGLGLGNCDTSSFAIFNTPFYQSHSYLNYNWLSSAFLFLETGYVGIIIYITFFVMVFVFANKIRKRRECNTLYCQMSMLMSVICVLLMFYNSSLRTDSAYIVYFVLSLPFISTSTSVGKALGLRNG